MEIRKRCILLRYVVKIAWSHILCSFWILRTQVDDRYDRLTIAEVMPFLWHFMFRASAIDTTATTVSLLWESPSYMKNLVSYILNALGRYMSTLIS